MPLSSLDLALLAGGRAARMGGRPKPLLRGRDGQTLLARAALTLPGRAVLVVAPLDRQDALRAALSELSGERGSRLVADPGEGPGWAALAAARASDAELLLLAGGDHVRPSAELAARLVRVTAAGGAGAWVVRGGRPEPLFTVVRRAALLGAEVGAPPRSLTRLLGGLGLAEVAAEDLTETERAGLVDVDTPEEAARWGLS